MRYLVNISSFIMRVPLLQRWLKGCDGVAAMEAAMVFPILLTLMLGTFDLGNGILANQKTIRASQVTADLIARDSTIDAAGLDEAIRGGELALEPLSSASLGVDVVSISFDDDANPVIEWRETRNMPPMADVLTKVAPLAEPGEGVLVVGVNYTYTPLFAGFVVDTIQMQEIAFARGRKGAAIEYN